MGKKKKDGGKAGKGGGDGGLPPPPNLDQSRQGALEALLTFKIHGKEVVIDQYQEESEVFKDKNYHQKERNYQLKVRQSSHHDTLVQQSRKYEEELDSAESVGRDRVEDALTDKLELARRIGHDLKDLEERIIGIDQLLEVGHDEVKKWTNYKDEVQYEKASHIATIRQEMQDMEKEETDLRDKYAAKLKEAQLEIEGLSGMLLDREKSLITDRILQSMDKDAKAELSDNAWLKKEIAHMQKVLAQLRKEADAMEYRNLQLLQLVTSAQIEEIENTRELYLTSTRKGTRSLGGGTGSAGSDSGLPSLVNVSKCTSEQGPGGQVGQLEMKMLSLQGSRAPFNTPPDTFHLPPLDEQRSAHTALPPRTSWPISNNMLKSVI